MMNGNTSSSSVVSEQFGNLILKELYSIKHDVKKEIHDLGEKLIKLLSTQCSAFPNEENEMSLFSNIDNKIKSCKFADDDHDHAPGKRSNEAKKVGVVGGYRSVEYHDHTKDNAKLEVSKQDFSLLSNDSITETNLMLVASGTSNAVCDAPLVKNEDSGHAPSIPALISCFNSCNDGNPSAESDCNEVECSTVNANQTIDIGGKNLNNGTGNHEESSAYTWYTSEKLSEVKTLPFSKKISNNSTSTAAPVLPSVSVIKCEDIEQLCSVNGVSIESESDGFSDDTIFISSDESTTNPEVKKTKFKSLNRKGSNKQNSKLDVNTTKKPSNVYLKRLRKSNANLVNEDFPTTQKGQAGHSADRGLKKSLKKRSFACKVCGRTFPRRNGLSIHIKYCHKSSMYLSKQNNQKKYGDKTGMKRYTRMHKDSHDDDGESSSDEMTECSICNKVLYTNGMYNLHMQSHLKQSCFNCKYCSVMIFGLKNLHLHMNEHLNKTSFVCDKCGKGFSSNKRFLVHMERHKRAPLNCIVCNKSFVRQATLTLHLQTFHGYALYECSVCRSVFSSKQKLQRHNLKLHSSKSKISSTSTTNSEKNSFSSERRRYSLRQR